MRQETRIRVHRGYALQLPRELARAVGIREGGYVRLRLEDSRIILEPERNCLDPFEYALRGPKFAETSFEEFERESEEMQSELLESED